MNSRDAEILLAAHEKRQRADACLVELQVHYNGFPGPKQSDFYSRGQGIKYSRNFTPSFREYGPYNAIHFPDRRTK